MMHGMTWQLWLIGSLVAVQRAMMDFQTHGWPSTSAHVKKSE